MHCHGPATPECKDCLLFVTAMQGRTALRVSCGSSFVCALLDDRSVKCWGSNGRNSAGNVGDSPGEMGDYLPTVDLGKVRAPNHHNLFYYTKTTVCHLR
jgi:E3 ubiquitin-protein ligase HERC3